MLEITSTAKSDTFRFDFYRSIVADLPKKLQFNDVPVWNRKKAVLDLLPLRHHDPYVIGCTWDAYKVIYEALVLSGYDLTKGSLDDSFIVSVLSFLEKLKVDKMISTDQILIDEYNDKASLPPNTGHVPVTFVELYKSSWESPEEQIRLSKDLLLHRLPEFLPCKVKWTYNVSWIKYMKYKLAAVVASHLPGRQHLPVDPLPGCGDNPRCFFRGRAQRYFSYLKSKDSKKFSQLLMTLLLGVKKGMPRPNEEMCDKSKRDTFIKLTSQPLTPGELSFKEPVRDPLNGKILDSFTMENLKFQLRRTTRELFEGATLSIDERMNFGFPSTSANYNRTRGMGGGVTAVLESKSLKNLKDRVSRDFVDKEYFLEEIKKVFLQGELSQLFGTSHDLEQVEFDKTVTTKETIGVEFHTLLDQYMGRFYTDLCWEALLERPIVELVALQEALKVRVISKGPPILYYLLKPIQKWLWTVLKRNKVFRLIGEQINLDIINETFLETFSDCTTRKYFLSGDYEASTDNLYSYVSQEINNELSTMFREAEASSVENPGGDPLFLLLERALINHLIEDPDDGTLHTQLQGQLMGSVVSFPFLCIANAAMCRYAKELADGRAYRITDKQWGQDMASWLNENEMFLNHAETKAPRAQMLINGDDCVFNSENRAIFWLWETVATMGGLKSSVGKTFFSHEFLQINSMQYNRISSGTFEEVKYINMGLIYGLGRTGGGKKSVLELASLQEELHSTIPASSRRLVDKMFFDVNREVLCRQSYDAIPWYLPKWCGGLGLKPCLDKTLHSDDFLRAAYVRREICGQGETIELNLRSDWLVHSIVTRKMRTLWGWLEQPFKEISLDGLSYSNLELENSGVYRNFVMGSLIDANSIEDLLLFSDAKGDTRDNRESSALRQLQKKWQKINKAIRTEKCFDLKPMSLEDLWTVNPTQYLPLVCY